MNDLIFISYANQDKSIADAVCSKLETQGLKCWYAPRDIVPGENWGASIIKAISSSMLMILIFSEHSNKSVQVMREIERAVDKKVTIIPFRIQDEKLSDDLEYFISSCQWLDAYTETLETHLEKLLETTIKTTGFESQKIKTISYVKGSEYGWWRVIDSGEQGEDVQIECMKCETKSTHDPLFGDRPSDKCPVCGFDGKTAIVNSWYVTKGAGMGDRDIICRRCRHMIFVTHYESDYKIPDKCPECGFSI